MQKVAQVFGFIAFAIFMANSPQLPGNCTDRCRLQWFPDNNGAPGPNPTGSVVLTTRAWTGTGWNGAATGCTVTVALQGTGGKCKLDSGACVPEGTPCDAKATATWASTGDPCGGSQVVWSQVGGSGGLLIDLPNGNQSGLGYIPCSEVRQAQFFAWSVVQGQVTGADIKQVYAVCEQCQ